MFSKSGSTADESFVSVQSDSDSLQLNEQYREMLFESSFYELIDDNWFYDVCSTRTHM